MAMNSSRAHFRDDTKPRNLILYPPNLPCLTFPSLSFLTPTFPICLLQLIRLCLKKYHLLNPGPFIGIFSEDASDNFLNILPSPPQKNKPY